MKLQIFCVRIRQAIAIVAASAMILFASSPSLQAQSGSRTYRQPAPSTPRYPPRTQSQRAPAQGSSNRAPTGSGSRTVGKPAMNGFCPVCIIELKQWVRGSERYAVNYDGQRYLFPGEEQMQMFHANPAKYVPAMGGKCTVCQVEMGETGPGSIYHAAFYRSRLYLFPGEEQKAMFKANPAKYADADLAFEGNCAVCLAEGNQRMPGKPEFAVIHGGQRYLFPSAEMRDLFLKSPEKYAAR